MEISKTLYVSNRLDWRAWLEANYASEKEVWLVYYKKHVDQPSIPYEHSVEEALCFGWIDSLIKKVDGERYARKFTPRRDGSNWSELNKRRVRKLVAEGRMTQVGLAKVDFPLTEAGDTDQSALARPEYVLSEDFEQEIKANQKAWENFQRLPPSHRRNYIGWVMSAKKEETRWRRFAEVLTVLEQGTPLGLK